MEGAHRLRNVLDASEAEILAGHVDPASDDLVNGARDTQMPGLGELLEACRNVHPLRVHAVAVGVKVAGVNADTKLDPAIPQGAWRAT